MDAEVLTLFGILLSVGLGIAWIIVETCQAKRSRNRGKIADEQFLNGRGYNQDILAKLINIEKHTAPLKVKDSREEAPSPSDKNPRFALSTATPATEATKEASEVVKEPSSSPKMDLAPFAGTGATLQSKERLRIDSHARMQQAHQAIATLGKSAPLYPGDALAALVNAKLGDHRSPLTRLAETLSKETENQRSPLSRLATLLEREKKYQEPALANVMRTAKELKTQQQTITNAICRTATPIMNQYDRLVRTIGTLPKWKPDPGNPCLGKRFHGLLRREREPSRALGIKAFLCPGSAS